MIKWIHHLFTPHCQNCREEKELTLVCKSCNVLSTLLEQERFTNKKLLDQIIELSTPRVETVHQVSVDDKDLRPKVTPWRVKQQALEAEDRKKAEILKKLEVEKMENKIGIVSESEEEINAG